MAATMTLERGGETVSTGDGAACPGDPLAALARLARTARDAGDPLRAGQVVLSGALGPMVPAAAGDVFSAEITGPGSVSVRFHASSDSSDSSDSRNEGASVYRPRSPSSARATSAPTC
ncbi:fumarylacetoacetate hydrolase family protein [Streptomyces sp. NPDC016845]|uniref:fumarylacetoacetate hydrolase family protein n=1 Tax=Streptomyces sp. NPDC016845 TaxID=3364972 RepID=UPI0037B6C24C